MSRGLREEQNYEAERAEERLYTAARKLGVSRRRLLEYAVMTGASAFLTACASKVGVDTTQPAPEQKPAAPPPAPEAPKQERALIKETPSSRFIDYGSNQEMRWDQMYGKGYVVPNDQFFVRNHGKTPQIDLQSWRLKVSGSGVENPLELTYDELLKLPSASVIRYVECAGNGRTFYNEVLKQKAQGTQWRLGAIGVAEWTGVRLSEVLERARLKKGARDFMPTGLDELKVRRPISVEKGLEDDTLLVYAMNGEPLPPDHGFPVRMLVPGWIGVANVKWVGDLEVSMDPIYSPWNTTSYVLIGSDYQPQGQAKGPVVTTQAIKSAIEMIWPGALKAGPQVIRGRAWSPFGKIAKVEYSLDDGRTWEQARLGDMNIARAWVRWEFPWDAKPGDYKIKVRATDEQGNSQPDSVKFNEQGYLYNAVVAHPVTVS